MTKKLKFTTSEKIVGVGLIGGVMSIDSVVKSKYGGFKYKKK